jgi:cell pole-organizing protein PopZ
MSEQTSQEPTMEEILASIRRIISEDDAPADAAAPAPEPEPEPVEAAAPVFEPEPEPIEEDDDGALELTERVESVGDLDVYTPSVSEEPEPPVYVEPPPPPPMAPAIEVGDGLVGAVAASAAASAFGQLSAAIQMPAEGRTLEDVVRELLRPLLKQWLDDNLPAIVQQTVDKEVERIARGRVR